MAQASVAVGFEDLSLEVAGWRDLPSGVEWTPLGGLIDHLRMTKDPVELDLLRQACLASDETLADVLPRMRAGVTERRGGPLDR